MFGFIWRSLLSFFAHNLFIFYQKYNNSILYHYAGDFGWTWFWWCMYILRNGDVPVQSCQGCFPLRSNADKWTQCPWHVPTAGWFPAAALILLNDNINKIKQTNTECCLFSLIQITLSFYDYVLIPFFRSRWTQMALSKRHRNSYTPTARTGLQPPSTSTRHCWETCYSTRALPR